ncbi:hypothetical protein BRADI_5g00986v3 [Brachypodium distachyon]|uniref:Uncharacterized protein n=1 Tax=Brachypodium distachyon TaxID=15368 RepID=A0A0Q3E5J3_BRADI|nr:hypothetical protein BRADI_5g00986v3 [Brachypodium distachyon]
MGELLIFGGTPGVVTPHFARCPSWQLFAGRCGNYARAYFEQKLIRSPAEIVCYACAFLRYWVDLQKEEDKTNLLAGTVVLQAEALQHHDMQARLDMDQERESRRNDQDDRKGKRKADDDGTN